MGLTVSTSSELLRTQIERILEALVIIAALATIPLAIAQARGSSDSIVVLLDWLIWGIFAAEFMILIAISPDRSAYARRHWLSVAVIILSFPLLHSILALSRLARLARLVRLTRLLLIAGRGTQAIRIVFGRNEVMFIFAMATFLVLAGGAALAVLEPATAQHGIWDGIWWAIVTSTTVGYGDISPQTFGGRLVGIVLMLVGIGLVSTLAAAIAAYFVGQDEQSEIEELRERLERMEKLLLQIADNHPERPQE